MTRLKLPKERLEAIPPDCLENYLLGHGWERDAATASEKVAGYSYPSEPDAEALVPLWKGFGDYALRVADVLEMIAAVEQRWTWEVFVELENAAKGQARANQPLAHTGNGPGASASENQKTAAHESS